MHVSSQYYTPSPATLEQLCVFPAKEQMWFVTYSRQYSDLDWQKIKASLSNSLKLIDTIYKGNKKKYQGLQ